MRFCAYLRVSSDKQREANTIENQRRAIDAYLTYNPRIEIAHVFEDNGVSAFKDRPNYEAMMRHLDDFDGIIVAKLSRIGRSTKQLLAIVDELHAKGKELVVVGDNIDTTTPQGRLFFTILAAFNEYEAALIRERMAEGLRRYKANGGRIGRPRTPLQDVGGDGAPSEKKLKAMYERGLGLKTMAKLFGVTRNTMRERLVEIGVQLRKPKGF